MEELLTKLEEVETQQEAINLARQAFGARAGADLASAVREGRFEIGNLIETLRQSDTTIDGTEKSSRDLSKRWTSLSNSIKKKLAPAGHWLIDVFDENKDKIDLLASAASKLNSVFQSLPGWLQETIKWLAIIAVIAGPTIWAIGAIFSAFGTLIGWIVTAAGVIKSTALAIGGAIAALAATFGISFGAMLGIIALIIGAALLLWWKWDEITGWIGDAVDWLGEKFGKGKDWIVETLGDLKDDAIGLGKDIVEGLKSGISEKWESFKGWVGDKMEGLKDAWNDAWDRSSPSGWAEAHGQDVMKGWQRGLDTDPGFPGPSDGRGPFFPPGFGGGGGAAGAAPVIGGDVNVDVPDGADDPEGFGRDVGRGIAEVLRDAH
jgi:hypothetical protein